MRIVPRSRGGGVVGPTPPGYKISLRVPSCFGCPVADWGRSGTPSTGHNRCSISKSEQLFLRKNPRRKLRSKRTEGNYFVTGTNLPSPPPAWEAAALRSEFGQRLTQFEAFRSEARHDGNPEGSLTPKNLPEFRFHGVQVQTPKSKLLRNLCPFVFISCPMFLGSILAFTSWSLIDFFF